MGLIELNNMIDKKSFKINDKNYYKSVNKKERIILGNTFSSDMSYIKGWELRNSGESKKTVAFTIDKDGKIYQHYDPKYYSEFLGDDTDQSNILINLVNEGWLTQRKDAYYNLRNEVYLGDVVEKYWRGLDYWVNYTDEQYESLRSLLLDLMKQFDIYERVVSDNTKKSNITKLSGMLTKSNFSDRFTDLSPTFDFNNLKKKE